MECKNIIRKISFTLRIPVFPNKNITKYTNAQIIIINDFYLNENQKLILNDIGNNKSRLMTI